MFRQSYAGVTDFRRIMGYDMRITKRKSPVQNTRDEMIRGTTLIPELLNPKTNHSDTPMQLTHA